MNKLDSDAFITLLSALQHRVRAFIAAIMPRSTDIDDVLQSTLVVAWKKLNDFSYFNEKPDEEFVRWLCAIARFEALELMRVRGDQRLVFGEQVLDMIVDMHTSDQFQEQWDERRDALRKCIGKLGRHDKDLVEEVYEGTAVADVAARSGKTRQGVYKSLRRIRSSLLNCIQAQVRAWEA